MPVFPHALALAPLFRKRAMKTMATLLLAVPASFGGQQLLAEDSSTPAPSGSAVDHAWFEAPKISFISLSGGTVRSRHVQPGGTRLKENYYYLRDGRLDRNIYNQQHDFMALKVGTENYGTWGMYLLSPNSVYRSSVGMGYVTPPLTWHVYKGIKAELTGNLGAVSGYGMSLVPFAAAEASLYVPLAEKLELSLDCRVMPYLGYGGKDGKSRMAGVVGISPTLGIRYRF